MENQAKSRLSYIDAARGVGILLIVFGHISYISNPIEQYGYSFHLALFYLISGYLLSLRKGDNSNNESYIYSRLRRLGIPYIFFSFITIVGDIIRIFLGGGGCYIYFNN